MGRWLRGRRLRIALWTAVVEGILVVTDVVPGLVALVVAAAVIAFYVLIGRQSGSDAVRQASWVAAASQVLVALVPVLVFIIGTLAIVAVALIAVVGLAALFADRR